MKNLRVVGGQLAPLLFDYSLPNISCIFFGKITTYNSAPNAIPKDADINMSLCPLIKK